MLLTKFEIILVYSYTIILNFKENNEKNIRKSMKIRNIINTENILEREKIIGLIFFKFDFILH